jgi:deoxyribonuclease-4
MRFGFHIPITGGLGKVPSRAVERGCDTIQIFSRSPRLWRSRELKEDEVALFRAGIAQAGIQPLVIHSQYLVNLASSDASLWERSWRSLAEDFRRAEALGAQFVVSHPGSRGEGSLTEAIRRAAEGIRCALNVGARHGSASLTTGAAPMLLENTAGGGSLLGGNFEELAAIAEACGSPESVGLCLDTAHAYEAGHDIASKEGLEAVLSELDRLFGLDRVRVVHANDSATALGSRRDRHWDVGEGRIGEAGFRLILSHPRLRQLPFIMETPTFELERDLRNMARIRRLASEVSPPASSPRLR